MDGLLFVGRYWVDDCSVSRARSEKTASGGGEMFTS